MKPVTSSILALLTLVIALPMLEGCVVRDRGYYGRPVYHRPYRTRRAVLVVGSADTQPQQDDVDDTTSVIE